MSVERKPYSHSIVSILGLKDASKQNVESFRPYCKPKSEFVGDNRTFESTDGSVARLVPQTGNFPRESVLVKNEIEQCFVRCGLQMKLDDNKLDSFKTTLKREDSEQGI